MAVHAALTRMEWAKLIGMHFAVHGVQERHAESMYQASRFRCGDHHQELSRNIFAEMESSVLTVS